MKKMSLLLSLAFLVLGTSCAAQALPINPGGGTGLKETSLWAVINELIDGAAVTQETLEALEPLHAIPAGTYKVDSYFKASGFKQDFGFFAAGDSPIQGLDRLVQAGPNGYTYDVNIPFSEGNALAFSNFAQNPWHEATYTITTETGNRVGAGLIFDFGPQGYIVAFEDAGGARNMGDKDYNDFVAHISTPIPGSLLLLGSGLIGVLGLRRKMVA